MSRIAVIDADLIGRKKHRFPNLDCMKLSGYHKTQGDSVILKTDYYNLSDFDKVYIAKVFTDTAVPDGILSLPNIEYGGTGFFYDKSPKLPYEIEHTFPDYNLYTDYIDTYIAKGIPKKEFSFYFDYSIGFLTRGCFRQCPFCVNRNYKQAQIHSPLSEFLDTAKKKICLLDDNFLACSDWERMLDELKETNKPFQFRQGLDERILTEKKCEKLFSSKYDGDYKFAFDDIEDAGIITKKLQLIRKYSNRKLKFYVFTGFDRTDKWDLAFWKQDIIDLFDRIKILIDHYSLPYIMRHARYKDSPYANLYTLVARWCNQPYLFYSHTLKQFAIMSGGNGFSCLKQFKQDFPKHHSFLDLKGEKNL